MSIFENLKKMVTRKSQRRYYHTYNNFNQQTVISSLVGQIQDSLLVKSCIDATAKQMKKLAPRHIRIQENQEIAPVYDSISRVLECPNPLMSMSDMIEKLVWTLLLNFNAYVLPVWSESGEQLEALWPIPGETYEQIQDPSGTTFLKVTFRDGTTMTLRYDRIIHLRHRFSLNDFFGGNAMGGADVQALLDALNLTNAAFDSIETSIEMSRGILGIYKTKTFLAEDSKDQVIESLNRLIKNHDSGILPIDEGADYVPIDRKPVNLEPKIMEMLETRILRYFGVSHAILSGDFTNAQKQAFYDATLEPLCVTFSDAFTKGIFSVHERASYGHRIHFYASRIDFMSDATKMEMVRFFGDRGSMYENEMRSIFNLPPIPELEGVRMQSLNYINTDDATEYQMNGNGLKKKDEEKEL